MGDAIVLVSVVVGMGLTVWFWPHCAAPALRAFDARPVAYRIGLFISALLIVALGVAVIARLMHIPLLGTAFLSVAGILWLGVVATTLWPRYSILVRLFARRGA